MAEKMTVAIVGAGPVGLAALKCMKEEGFDVTCFEVRDNVGGVWNYSTDKDTTTCLKDTMLNSSKFVSHYSDFPFPDDYPTYPPAPQMNQYFRSYTDHFNLRPSIQFKTKVTGISRDELTGKWVLALESAEAQRTETYDKLIISNGLVYRPVIPKLEGQDEFKGKVLHGRDYKSSSGYEKQNVVVVGMGNTAADVAVDLAGTAANVYLSHRRGALVLSRFRLGAPIELTVNYHTLQMMNHFAKHLPSVYAGLLDYITKTSMDKSWEIDPAWGLKPSPSMSTVLPCINEGLIPNLAKGTITSVKGFRRFVGERSVELDDGSVLQDIDTVVLGTGYTADTTVTPWLKTSLPKNYGGGPLPRLYLQVFPPENADSLAVLNHYAATDCAWVVSELSSMAIAQLWSGRSSFPSRAEMDASVDRLHELEAKRWRQDHSIQPGAIPAAEFYRFMHTKAGTGVREAMSWGPSGWSFRWRRPEVSKLMSWGVVTPFMMRLVETGKRKTWDGAEEAIKKTNAEAKGLDRTVRKFMISDVLTSTDS